MRSKLMFSGLLASVFVIPALAQQTPAPAPETPAARSTPAAPAAQSAPAPVATTRTTPVQVTGQWRASKLIGLDVYNEQNEKLGDINEILLDQAGKVNGVVIGVGGFLGMGEREIMVTMDKLKFVNEPHRVATATRPSNTTGSSPSTAPATTAAGDRTTTTTTTNTGTTRAANEKWYPDHAIMSGATKDSLKAMAEWKYN